MPEAAFWLEVPIRTILCRLVRMYSCRKLLKAALLGGEGLVEVQIGLMAAPVGFPVGGYRWVLAAI